MAAGIGTNVLGKDALPRGATRWVLDNFLWPGLSKKGGHKVLHGSNQQGKLVKIGGDGNVELARVFSN